MSPGEPAHAAHSGSIEIASAHGQYPETMKGRQALAIKSVGFKAGGAVNNPPGLPHVWISSS
jgi:hypothetical protein